MLSISLHLRNDSQVHVDWKKCFKLLIELLGNERGKMSKRDFTRRTENYILVFLQKNMNINCRILLKRAVIFVGKHFANAIIDRHSNSINDKGSAMSNEPTERVCVCVFWCAGEKLEMIIALCQTWYKL